MEHKQTNCCIVGAGPAGAVLSLLLARQGISTVLLEAHRDFDRDFRGDTIQPSTMEIMAQLGLADRLLELPHSKLDNFKIESSAGKPLVTINLSRLKTAFPFITVMPQSRFIEFILDEAQKYPNFELRLSSNVQEIVRENGVIHGVRYRKGGEWHEIKPQLTVAADGRHSRLRHLAELDPITNSPPMDVLWFRIPRSDHQSQGVEGRVGKGQLVILIERSDSWQVGYIIPKGKYQEIRSGGLEKLRIKLIELLPEFQAELDHLQHWDQVAFLAVESSYLPQWYLPGLLLIGDAAHVMSPVGGVGINYAIADAVVAANVLTVPLKTNSLELKHLAMVQRQRFWPTRVIQFLQSMIQQQLIQNAFDHADDIKIPCFIKLPVIRDIPPYLIALGLNRAHVKYPTANLEVV